MTVVLNRSAGGEMADGMVAKLEELFRSHGVTARIVRGGGGLDVHEVLASAKVAPDATVIAGGGDGTVRAVAAEAVGTERCLGVLPMGTLNHFAKDLGIPLKLEDAVRALADGIVSTVDVGEVNGRVFVNNSGLGLYPQIVFEREADQKRRGSGKWPAFARAALNAFRRFPFLHLSVDLEGNERLLKTAFVFVGNNEYEVTGLNFGGRSCLSSGKLGFYAANRTSRTGLLRLAFFAMVGRVHHAKDFEKFCVKEARIESPKRKLLVTTDGEVTEMKPPLHYRIRPAALRVIIPRISEKA